MVADIMDKLYNNTRYRIMYIKKFIKYSKIIKPRMLDVMIYSVLGSSPTLTSNHSGELFNKLMSILYNKYEYINGQYVISLDYSKVEAINYEVLTKITRHSIVKYVREDSCHECKRTFNFYLYELRKLQS